MSQVHITVVGDVAFSRSLADDPVTVVNHMPLELREHLKADILVANLECTVGKPVPKKSAKRHIQAVASPPAALDALKVLGVDAVSLANNHVFDGGVDGLVLAQQLLQEHGIHYFGAGLDYQDAAQPLILDRNGLRVAFLGFSGCECAGRNKAGTILLDANQSRRLIRKTKDNCDILVVYFHEGVEALNYPLRSTMKSCHKAIHCGADLVVGTHPHTVQGIEWYRGVPIVYSLGNFIMPLLNPELFAWWYPQTALMRMGRPFDRKTVARALILKVSIGRGHRTEVEGVPILLDESGIPRVPTGPEMIEEQAFFRGLCEAFKQPDDPTWRMRDVIERQYVRLGREDIHWGYVLRNLHRLRPRHVWSYMKMWR